MTDKHSFILYDYIADQVNALTDEEAGLLLKGILHYVQTGQQPDLPRVVMMVFINVRNDIDRANTAWQEKHQALSEAGKRGAVKKSKGAKRPAEQDPDADLELKKARSLALLGMTRGNY